MKRLYFMGLTYFLVLCVLYIGIYTIFDLAFGNDTSLQAIFIKSLIFSALFVSVQILIGYYSFFPRIKYLENNDIAKPAIKNAYSSVIDLPQEVDFNRLKSKIADKWAITFSDNTNQVLKFTTKINFYNLFKYPYAGGLAAWLKFDGDAGKIYLECFPISEFHSKKLLLKKLNEFEELLRNEIIGLI